MHHNSSEPLISTSNWVGRISNIFNEEIALQIDDLPPACIFEVTKTLKSQKPEAYTPHLVGMGVYHHLQPDLYHMERYKLGAITQLCTPDQVFHFQQLVINHLKEIDPSSRACYNKFLDYDQDTIAWIMGIDGCFLLNLMNSNLDSTTRKTLLGNTMVTRDIMMVENQIPYLHLKEIRRCLGDNQDRALLSMFLDFCQLISPLKLNFDKNLVSNYEPLHLLDLLYYMIVISVRNPSQSGNVDAPSSSSSSASISSSSSDSHRRRESEDIQNKLEAVMGFVDAIGNEHGQKIMIPIRAVTSIPWSSISGIFRNGTIHHGKEDSSDKEIEIPSVSHMYRYANVKCLPISRGGINDIKFVESELTLYLPVLSLNSTSEVILRNLVAYEAAMSKPSLEFARYTNLMNGIIDTAEDVKLLKQNGVIVDVSLRDEEIADLFNGMQRFYVKHYKKSNIEIAIDKVNGYYNEKRIVRWFRQMKRNAYASWKVMAIVSTLLMFVVLGMETFCQVYGCSRLW